MYNSRWGDIAFHEAVACSDNTSLSASCHILAIAIMSIVVLISLSLDSDFYKQEYRAITLPTSYVGGMSNVQLTTPNAPDGRFHSGMSANCIWKYGATGQASKRTEMWMVFVMSFGIFFLSFFLYLIFR